MIATNKHQTLRNLLAVSMCAGSVAFAGEPYSAPAPAPAPAASSGMWNWFAGASIGYLLDAETEMYHGHLGVDFASNGTLTHSLFVEVGYAEGLDVAFANVVTGNFGGNGPGPDTGLLNLNGQLEVIPVTFNYKVEGCITGSLNWYAGLGLGFAYADASYTGTLTGPTFPGIGRSFSENDTVFAGQVFVGLMWQASDRFEVYTGLRYIYVDDPDLTETLTGASLDVSVDDYLGELGFRFNF
jgi:opacity protein-like surface antigen